MTTSVQTFAFKPTGSDEQVNLRTAIIDGEPWFVATDVCRALGAYLNAYGTVNTTAAVEKLTVFQVQRVPFNRIGGSAKSSMKVIVVSEGGLYALIMRSDKPEAKAFQAWVTDEVLPAIRKTGGYLLNETARATAHADTRTEMPLPAGFGELLKANLAMAELLAQALVNYCRQATDTAASTQECCAMRLVSLYGKPSEKLLRYEANFSSSRKRQRM